MEISTAKLHALGVPDTWTVALQSTMERYEITTPNRIAMCVAQCGHESDSFTHVVENLNYSAAALHRVWPKRFPTVESAIPFARQPEKIANKVYGNRMGNGDEASGDGWKYRGRGLIQLTGRANYSACAHDLGVDFVGDPGLLVTPRHACLSAGWFWKTRGLNPLADKSDVQAVTRKINGGDVGMADRRARYDKALDVLTHTPPKPIAPATED